MSCHDCGGHFGEHARACPGQPGCRWCGRDVSVPDSLCAECSEERQERDERRLEQLAASQCSTVRGNGK